MLISCNYIVKICGIGNESNHCIADKMAVLNPYNLKVGSKIQYSDTPQYGVIKWIGQLRDEVGVYAGLEMVRF